MAWLGSALGLYYCFPHTCHERARGYLLERGVLFTHDTRHKHRHKQNPSNTHCETFVMILQLKLLETRTRNQRASATGYPAELFFSHVCLIRKPHTAHAGLFVVIVIIHVRGLVAPIPDAPIAPSTQRHPPSFSLSSNRLSLRCYNSCVPSAARRLALYSLPVQTHPHTHAVVLLPRHQNAIGQTRTKQQRKRGGRGRREVGSRAASRI